MHEAAGGQAQHGTTVIGDDVIFYRAVTLSATGWWKDARRPYPANNLRLEVAQFTCADDIQRVLAPYLAGKGLPGRAHRVVVLPTQAHIPRALAKHDVMSASPR